MIHLSHHREDQNNRKIHNLLSKKIIKKQAMIQNKKMSRSQGTKKKRKSKAKKNPNKRKRMKRLNCLR